MIAALFAGGIITKVVMIVALAGFLGSGASCAFKSFELGKAESKVESLQTENKQLSTDNEILKSNNATLKENLVTVAKVNESTVDANKKLLNERKSSWTAINTLAAAREAERKNVEAANKKIDEMLKNPSNNGPVAPVLRETLRDIQSKK